MRHWAIAVMGFIGCGGGPSRARACTDQAQAHCARFAACSASSLQAHYGTLASCESRYTENCLNALSAPGTSRTTTEVEACAQAYPNWACNDFLDTFNAPSACKLAGGTLANGKACAFPSQCVSAFCAVTPGSACGTCAIAPALGDSCAALTACKQGIFCASDTQKCALFATAGQPCGVGAACGAGLWCVGENATTGAAGVCQTAIASLGAACETAADEAGCDRDAALSCNTRTKQCAALALAAASAPCGTVGGQITPCLDNASCSTTIPGATGTCVAAAADGASCDVASGPGCGELARCVNGTCQFDSAATCQ
jgi:hypothetical protein